MARASIKKPGNTKAKRVAEIRASNPRVSVDKALKFAEKGKSKSGQIPEGDVRLTANIKEELHTRVKIEAAKRRMYIGDLIEELIENNIPKL